MERAGGKVGKKDVTIKVQTPAPVRYEQAFEGLWPMEKAQIGKDVRTVGQLSFEGQGVVVGHRMTSAKDFKIEGYEAQIEVSLDGTPDQTVLLPVDSHNRKQEIYHNYDLSDGKHTLDFKWLNPVPGVEVAITYLLPYKARPEEIDTF